MTLQTAYSQTLNSDAAIGSPDYAYGVVTSPMTASGEGYQLTLVGPASGTTVGSDMWSGVQSAGYNYVPGSQKPVTFGGSPNFTISAGQTLVSDPIMSPLAVGDRVLTVFDLHGGAGRVYRRKSISGLSYAYTSGQQNAANGDVSRSFTNLANYTALIAGVVVGEAVDFEPVEPDPNPPPPADDPGDDTPAVAAYPWFDAIRGDQLFSSGKVFEGVPGQHLAVGLFNPAGSGRHAYLHQIDINADADTVVTVHAMSPVGWPVVPSRCNLDFRTGSPASIAKLHASSVASIPIGLHAFKKVKGGVDGVVNKTIYPLTRVAPGYGGYVIVLHAQGVGATINFHWQEVPVS